MQRVLVIGSPGAGKTTFSRKLAEKTDLPLIHLDFYYHQTKFNYYKNEEAWREKMRELIAGDEWIIEGNYPSTYNIRFARADCIFLLEIPRIIALKRVLKRHIVLHKKRRSEMPSDWKEKLGRDYLFRYLWRFKDTQLSKVYNELKKHPDKKVITLKNSGQVNEYLKML